MSRVKWPAPQQLIGVIGVGKRKKIGNNFYFYHPTADVWQCKFHDTYIADITYNNIVLRTGGWMTSTTKQRLNVILNREEYFIFQQKFEWYLAQPTSRRTEPIRSFYDGMVITRKHARPLDERTTGHGWLDGRGSG